MAMPADLVAQLADWITTRRVGADDLLFATRDGTPISRNTFRTRIWRPAIKASGVEFNVRVHDLRHAHDSWLLAGGSDLKSVMDRMGHAQITTTQKYLHALPTPTPRTSTPSTASAARTPETPTAPIREQPTRRVRRTGTGPREFRPGPRPGCAHGSRPGHSGSRRPRR